MNDRTSTASDPLSRLAASRAAFIELRPGVQAGEPWPLAADFGTGPEAAWGPREVLAHTAEMLPFWLGEYERIVEAGRGPGDGLPFGRVAGDPLRIGILERDRTLPLRELFDRIDTGIDRWERRLARGMDGEASAAIRGARAGGAVGLHSRLGEMTADDVRDRFVVTHLEEHVAQLRDTLDRE